MVVGEAWSGIYRRLTGEGHVMPVGMEREAFVGYITVGMA